MKDIYNDIHRYLPTYLSLLESQCFATICLISRGFHKNLTSLFLLAGQLLAAESSPYNARHRVS